MPGLGESSNQLQILHAANAYLGLGYSPIPLLGDAHPDKPKAAAVAWSVYQRRRPTPNEISSWFASDDPYAAIAIITGAISQLAVLDFDDPALAQRFKLRFPDLTETRTVQTRRGIHLYFHIPPNLHPRSRKVSGADLLYEGHYVVAPPSIIGGHRYTVSRGGQPKILTAADIQGLEAFLDQIAPMTPKISSAPHQQPPAAHSEPSRTITEIISPPDALVQTAIELGAIIHRRPKPTVDQIITRMGDTHPAKLDTPSSLEALRRKAFNKNSALHTQFKIIDRATWKENYRLIETAYHTNDSLALATFIAASEQQIAAAKTEHWSSGKRHRTANLPPIVSQTPGSTPTLTEESLSPAESPTENCSQPDIAASPETMNPPSTIATSLPAPPLATNDLTGLYHSQAKILGRNEALFWVSILARDHGWQQQDTLHALLRDHLHQPANGPHRSETPELRQRESVATVASAFSRPARPPKEQSAPFLWNSVREALDQRKLTKIHRVLDGLRLRGIQPGQHFTRNQALRLLAGIVGRDAVYAALADRGVFSVAPPQTPSPSSAAISKAETNSFNARVRVTKSGKTRGGRSPALFVMPSNRELCAKLGVRPSRSDPVMLDDLGSAKTTRHAAHRELIRRRPGLYACGWLAQRLGVSKMSVRRYNKSIPGLHVAPTYIQTPISRYSLNNVPEDESQAPAGIFLETDSGKRFPPIRALAGKLLKVGASLRLMRQTVNYYWFGPETPMGATSPARKSGESAFKSVMGRFAEHIGQHIVIQTPQERPAPPITVPVGNPVEASAPTSDNPPKKQLRKPNYRKPLPDERSEALAARVQQTINQMCTSSADHLSLFNARKLVDQYGHWLVGRVLAMMSGRRNVRRPAGFLCVALRSEQKAM